MKIDLNIINTFNIANNKWATIWPNRETRKLDRKEIHMDHKMPISLYKKL